MRPVTAPADLFSAAAKDGMDRPAARITSNRRSSSLVQGLFCCVGTIVCPSLKNEPLKKLFAPTPKNYVSFIAADQD